MERSEEIKLDTYTPLVFSHADFSLSLVGSELFVAILEPIRLLSA